MRYIANPVIVEAGKIDDVKSTPVCGVYELIVEGFGRQTTTAEMTSRMIPQVGDYFVRQEDGYVYLNPKGVFERKYRPMELEERPLIRLDHDDLLRERNELLRESVHFQRSQLLLSERSFDLQERQFHILFRKEETSDGRIQHKGSTRGPGESGEGGSGEAGSASEGVDYRGGEDSSRSSGE